MALGPCLVCGEPAPEGSAALAEPRPEVGPPATWPICPECWPTFAGVLDVVLAEVAEGWEAEDADAWQSWETVQVRPEYL